MSRLLRQVVSPLVTASIIRRPPTTDPIFPRRVETAQNDPGLVPLAPPHSPQERSVIERRANLPGDYLVLIEAEAVEKRRERCADARSKRVALAKRCPPW